MADFTSILPFELSGVSLESLIKQEPTDGFLVGNSVGHGTTAELTPGIETTDPDLNDLLQSLSREDDSDPRSTTGGLFNQFPLDNGIDLPGVSGVNGHISDNCVNFFQSTHQTTGQFIQHSGMMSLHTQHPGHVGLPALHSGSLLPSMAGPAAIPSYPILPDAVNNVTSHEGLDRLMSMVQRQSEALHSTNLNFSTLDHTANGISRSHPMDSMTCTNSTLIDPLEANGFAACSGQGETRNANIPRTVQLTEPHTLRNSNDQNERIVNSNPFHIDTTLLSAVPVSEQSAELQNLGLTVYNRDDIEQGIMAQVDQAMAQNEEERLKKILEKELKGVVDDIRNVKQDLMNASKIERMIGPSPANREAKRKMDAVKKQKENKVKQLRKLKAKQKLLKMKLEGNTDGLASEDEQLLAGDGEVVLQDALGIGSQSKETEMERMIRQGEMTPFGTVVSEASKSDGPRLSKDGEMTSFEKYLMDQQQKISKKKQSTLKKSRSEVKQTDKGSKKSSDSKAVNHAKKTKLTKSHSSPALSQMNGRNSDSGEEMPSLIAGKPKDRPDRPNLFDAKDKRRYRPSERDFSNYRSGRARFARLQHNFTGDRRLSDHEEYEDDDVYGKDADYVPNADMLMEDDSDYLSGNEHAQASLSIRKSPKKKRLKRAPTAISVGDEGSSEEDEPTSKKKKGKGRSEDSEDVSLRTRDDGDFDCYKRRIRNWKTSRLKRKQQKAVDGETDSSDSEFENVEVDDGFKVPAKVWNNLYPYQRTCVRWLYELHGQQAGGIVGDEMGLGKTVQIISFLVGLKVSRLADKGASTKYRGLGPTLIVCPATVMHQWVREFHKWWAPFRVAVLHNSGSFTSSVAQLIDDIASSHGILVTSYASVTQNQDALLEYDWHYVVLDEGHKIRNPDAQVTVAAKRFRTCHRLILSGSPVQNNLKELWSLFDFVFPGKLGTLPDFMAHFSVPIVQGGYSTATQVQVQTAYKCACVLRDTINPYLLRRMKSDVRHNLTLPDKNEQVLFCRLTDDQRDVYREYLDSKECNMILKGDFMVFPGLITLRKICNHPDLSTGGPQDFESAYREYAEGERDFGHWKRSGKMFVVRSLLQLWRKQGHRVLLFTQSKQMLLILESFVISQGYQYLKMDGGTSVSARQPLINKFNKDTSYFVFLLTTRVGGLGVNLTGANRIIIYDPDWNPSTDTQARERAWRIGQTKQVTIYRLLSAGTIEEKIYHRQIFKQFLTNRVLKDPKQRRLFKANDLHELFSLNEVDTSGSTETSALFAGTGSDVKVSKPAPVARERRNGQTAAGGPGAAAGKVNRFDVLLEQRQKEKAAAEADEEDEDASDLREVIDTSNLSKNQVKRVNSANKGKGRHKNNNKTKAAVSITPTENTNTQDTDIDDKERTTSSKDKDPSAGGTSEAKDEKMRKMKELAKKLSQKLGKGKEDGGGTVEKVVSNEALSESSYDVSKDRDQSTSRHKHKKKKHKDRRTEKDGDGKKDYKHKHEKRHKKKKKDVVFEGERIAHLSKSEAYVPPTGKEEEQTNNADEDNYVLAKLLNKSGVHSALQHEKIMMSSDPDYALVEGEAERVAREAAQALRRSRHQCPNARSGIPTWTGQTGSAPPPKPRFGQKKNSKLLPSAPLAKGSPSKTSEEKKPEVATPSAALRHFDGTMAGNVQTDTGAPPSVMTSSQLLARMKARNALSLGEDGAGSSASVNTNSTTIDLITDIRNFIAFQSHVNGQGTTQEIVDYFKTKVPTGNSATFRAMLRNICDLHKRDGVGLWILKPEFR